MKIFQYFLIICMFLLFGCSESNLSAGGQTSTQKEQKESPKISKVDPKPTLDANPNNNDIDEDEDEGEEDDGKINQNTDTATDTATPDYVVDGQEVFGTCDKCLQRATTLAPQLGFQADMQKTINLGFYKIEPSKNLCDVHFMADMSIQVDDHEGEDTLGNSQVILYCPCDCAWAQDDSLQQQPFGNDFDFPGGYNGP
jgi:hypothetical protein